MSRFAILAILALSIASLAGCALPHKAGAPEQVSIATDQFTPLIDIVGTALRDVDSETHTEVAWRIRSWVAKNPPALMKHQLYVEFGYIAYPGGERQYNAAADEQANALTIVPIDRNAADCRHKRYGDCWYFETVGIDVGDATLHANQASGFRVKVSSHLGYASILNVTPDQIRKELLAVDQALAQARGGAAAPAGVRASTDRAVIGMSFRATNMVDRSIGRAPAGPGLIVVDVQPDGAAARAGIAFGDVLLAFDGRALNQTSDLTEALQALRVGDSARLRVWSKAREREVTVQF